MPVMESGDSAARNLPGRELLEDELFDALHVGHALAFPPRRHAVSDLTLPDRAAAVSKS